MQINDTYIWKYEKKIKKTCLRNHGHSYYKYYSIGSVNKNNTFSMETTIYLCILCIL